MKFLPRLAAAGLTLSAAIVAPIFTLGLAPAGARAAEAEASFDVFYNNLADQGDWYNTADYGYVWQPYIAYKNDQWRPYTDGYWAETDQGWTWVSYEDFGWACYHYGRWTQLESTGWVWVPGYEWGPGWVSWRTSDDYVGWAPLPPKHEQRTAYIEKVDASSEEPAPPPRPAPRARVTEGRVVDYGDVEEDYDVGYNSSVDVAYDIGPSHYCFVPVGNFGAPYVREFIVPTAQNVVIIERTTNVTNIVYRHGSRGGGARDRVVYCGGPDYNFIAQRTERPVPRLLLERRTDVPYDRAALRADQFNVIRDNRLEIAAPLIARRPMNFEQMRPLRVKETLDRPQPMHGWRGAEQQDPRLVERLRTQFQQQARQAPPARVAAERFITPAAFRAQPPPPIQQQQQAAGPRHLPPGAPPTPGAAAGFNGNPNPAVAPANVPPAPGPLQGRPARPGQPPPAVVNPAPPANGRALTEAERQAKRDAKLREMQDRQRVRGAGDPAPATANPAQPAQAPAPDRKARTPEEREAYRATKQQPAQLPPRTGSEAAAPAAPAPDRKGRTAEEREAYRASKQHQQPSPQTRAEAPAAPRTPEAAAPNRPSAQAGAEAERAREERRAARQQQESAAQKQQQQAQQEAAATRDRDKEARRAARQQEQARGAAAEQQQQQQQGASRAREEAQRQRSAERSQQQAAQQAQQGEQRAAAAREERQRGAAAQQQQQQAQQQRAEAAARAQQAQAQSQAQAQAQAQQNQQREARRAAAAQPQPAAQQPQGGGNSEEERKRKHRPDGQSQ